MLTSVRVLMTRVIDYAGLFPPAQLDMSAAFQEYGRHRMGAHGWMLGRFVCPVGRLAELEPLLGQLQPDDDMVHLSVLGSGGGTPEAFSRTLERDVREILRFVSSAGSQPVAVDQFEAPLPREAPPDALPGVVREAVTALGDLTPVPPLPFFECSLLEGWRDRIKPSVEAISENSGDGRSIGLKIRCGGTTGSAVPSAAAVAAAIAACRTAAVPLKATQGLHHPIRHFDVQLETTAHGFVNLFVGGALAQSIGVPEDRLLEVLEEEDPTAFAFTDETVTWHGHRLDIEDIAAGRRHAVTSFGSCSFDEPRNDLLELGLLDPAQPEPEKGSPS